MSVLADVQAQLTRKVGQLTTAKDRESVLDAAVSAGTASPEEILELNDLKTNVIPNLLSSQTALNAIATKLGLSVGAFGSMESILNDPKIFSAQAASQMQQFNVPECTNGIIAGGNELMNKMASGIDSLISATGTAINDAFGDDLAAIQAYLGSLNLFGDNMNSINDALNVLKGKLTTLAGIVSAAMAANPCMAAIGDKLMGFQSPADQAIYSSLKTAANDPSAKADIMKDAYSAIKLM